MEQDPRYFGPIIAIITMFSTIMGLILYVGYKRFCEEKIVNFKKIKEKLKGNIGENK